MLKPKFLLTKKIPLIIYRIGLGSWVDGKWVEGSETQVEIEVNIQPFKNHELMMLPNQSVHVSGTNSILLMRYALLTKVIMVVMSLSLKVSVIV